MTGSGVPTANVKLPDRVQAARILDASGEVRIAALGRRPSGRIGFEGRVVISRQDHTTLAWLQERFGGLVVLPSRRNRFRFSGRGVVDGDHWLVRGSRGALTFLRAVQPFAGRQKPWIETTIEFLEFQQHHSLGHGSKPLPIEIYMQQVDMFNRQQSLESLTRGRPELRVLEGLNRGLVG